jgi:hypothetical protein
MKQFREFVVNTLVGGLLIVAPIYLAVMLLLKAMQSLVGFVRPFAMLLPEWFPAENVLSLLLVLILCFLIGVAIRTPAGRAIRERIEKSLFERLPGYALFKSLTQRLAGESQENVWKPALARLRRPSSPHSSLKNLRMGAGAVYVLSRERVHPLNVPFTQAIQAVSRWGSGSKDLVAAIKTENTVR